MAAERVGLDTLAPKYLKMGADRHKMTYVAASSDAIPFPAQHFDVVCAFNSLDHVRTSKRPSPRLSVWFVLEGCFC